MSNMAQDSESTRVGLFAGELEEMARKEVESRRRLGNDVSALVFGRDVGKLAIRLAEYGAQVVIAATAQKTPPHPGLRAIPFSAGALPEAGTLPEAPFDVIVAQFALHSIPYEQARQALCRLAKMLKIGGKLYISTYGLHSMLGDHYPDSGKLVEERFAELPAALAALYDLQGSVCLYSERNLITLLFQVGTPVLQSATGAIGNIRAVAVRI
jgi:hypothetical protein